MAVVNPIGYEHNLSTHTAQVDRLAAQGLLLPSAAGELRGRGGVRYPSDLLVTAQATPNMSVSVSAGIGYVPGPTAVAGTYTFPNDAPVTVNITAAHATLARWDLIVARVQDSFYSGSTNLGDITVITGTAAASPADPALPAGASYLVLSRVVVPAAAASIVSGNIQRVAEQVQVAGSIRSTSATNIDAGLYDGQYKDHPTYGLMRWRAANSTWAVASLPRNFRRDYTAVASSIASGGVVESGVGSEPALANLVIPVPSYVNLVGTFRVAGGTGACLFYIKVNGSAISFQGLQRGADESRTIVGGVSLAAGTHTISVRGEGFGGTATLFGAAVIGTIGQPE